MKTSPFKTVLLCLSIYLLKKVKESSSSFVTETPCQSCMGLCRDAWFEKKFSSEICPHCMGQCSNDIDTIASFFNNHACINLHSLQISLTPATATSFINSNISSNVCEGLNNALHRTVQQGLLFLFNQCRSDLTAVRAQLILEEEVIEENSRRFSNPAEVNTTEVEDNRSSTRTGEIQINQVCPSTTSTQSPTHAYHKSGIRVNLLRKKKKYQFFHMSRCRPTLEPLTQVTGARCKTVKINHKALIRVTLSQQRQAAANGTPFANCKPPKYGFVICDDWVQLDGYCAMFV